MRTKDKVGPLKDDTGGIITEDQEAANMLNDYFSSVFTTEDCRPTHIPTPENYSKTIQKRAQSALKSPKKW